MLSAIHRLSDILMAERKSIGKPHAITMMFVLHFGFDEHTEQGTRVLLGSALIWSIEKVTGRNVRVAEKGG